MGKHIHWLDVASELIHGGWGEPGESEKTVVEKTNDTRLSLILLLDIAKSLRRLRCYDFKEIPALLRQIRLNTKKKKKK